MLQLLRRHPLIQTLRDLRGNPRAALFTEPLWGLSMNLCLPYASVYMLSFGMSDVQVGLIASIYMFSQTIFAFLSGAIIDRYGRRFSTMLFDLLSWSLPCLIWAYSQGFWFFVVAAMLNGMMKITTVSWDCLLVEDAPRDKITHVYSWVIIAGNLSALFAPISSILVARLTLIPAIRILYLNAFVVMTIKVLLLYRFSTETAVGRARQKAVAGGANLRCADLRGANLRGADLHDADLRYADLRGANLADVKTDERTKGLSMVCPAEGKFVGWKKAAGLIVKLKVPTGAKRSSATTNKCRCSKAEVLAIEELDGAPSRWTKKVPSDWNQNFVYEVGKTVEVENFDENRWNECSTGIHFFMTRREAAEW